MPITVAPVAVTADVVTRQTVQADQIHVDALQVWAAKAADEADGIPRLTLTTSRFATIDGLRAFGSSESFRSSNLFAALTNMAKAGFTAPAAALQAIYDAVPDIIAFSRLRENALDIALATLTKARAGTDAGAIEAATTAYETAARAVSDLALP